MLFGSREEEEVFFGLSLGPTEPVTVAVGVAVELVRFVRMPLFPLLLLFVPPLLLLLLVENDETDVNVDAVNRFCCICSLDLLQL